jgi:hypothetical protein
MKRPQGLLWAVCAVSLSGCFNPRDAADRRESANNLMQLGISINAFHDNFNRMPPAQGEPFPGPGMANYSWRVHLLPYIEQDNVYQAFVVPQALNPQARPDAWNDPRLLGTTIRLYEPPFASAPVPHGTFYRAFVGPGTAFDPQAPGGKDFGGKLMLVEAGEAVPWTRPQELEYAPDKPLPPLGGIFGDGFHGVYGDGEVRWVPRGTDEATLRAAITGTYAGERPGQRRHR